MNHNNETWKKGLEGEFFWFTNEECLTLKDFSVVDKVDWIFRLDNQEKILTKSPKAKIDVTNIIEDKKIQEEYKKLEDTFWTSLASCFIEDLIIQKKATKSIINNLDIINWEIYFKNKFLDILDLRFNISIVPEINDMWNTLLKNLNGDISMLNKPIPFLLSKEYEIMLSSFEQLLGKMIAKKAGLSNYIKLLINSTDNIEMQENLNLLIINLEKLEDSLRNFYRVKEIEENTRNWLFIIKNDSFELKLK